MKSLLKLAMAGAILVTGLAQAETQKGYCFEPYFGVDAHMKQLKFTKANNESLKHRAPQGHLHAGLKFNNYFGVELGTSLSRKKNADGQFSMKSNNMHLGLVGYTPTCRNFELFAGVGISHLKHQIKNDVLDISLRNAVPRGLVGLHYFFTPDFALRVSSIVEKTDKINVGDLNANNTFHYGIGLLFKL